MNSHTEIYKINKDLLNSESFEKIKFLIYNGADVNARDNDGWSILMCAKTAHQTRLLLKAGADVNAKTKDGDTALIMAKTSEQTRLLLDAGADVDAKNNNGYTALMMAEISEQTRLLLKAGADVDSMPDSLYETPTKSPEQYRLIQKYSSTIPQKIIVKVSKGVKVEYI